MKIVQKFNIYLCILIYQLLSQILTLQIDIQNPIKIPNSNQNILFLGSLNEIHNVIFFTNGSIRIVYKNLSYFNQFQFNYTDGRPIVYETIYLSNDRKGFIGTHQTSCSYVHGSFQTLLYDKKSYSTSILYTFSYHDQESDIKSMINVIVIQNRIEINKNGITTIIRNYTLNVLYLKYCVHIEIAGSDLDKIISLYCFHSNNCISRFNFTYNSVGSLLNKSIEQFFYCHIYNIKRMFVSQQILFFQDQYPKITAISLKNNFKKIAFGFDLINIPLNKIQIINGQYYLLSYFQFIKMNFDKVNLKLIKTQSSKNLRLLINYTMTSKRIALTNQMNSFNVFYIQHTPIIYPIKICLIQQSYDHLSGNCENLKQYQNQDLNQISQKYQNLDTSVKQIQNIMQTTNQFQTFRSQIQFLSPLFNLFDDYWYYIYHQNQMKSLNIIPLFFFFVFKTNSKRNSLNFIHYQLNSQSYLNTISKYTNFTQQIVLDVDKQKTFIHYNLRYFTLQAFSIIIVFLIIKCIIKIIDFYRLKSKQNEQLRFKSSSKSQQGIFISIKKTIMTIYSFIKKKLCLQTFLLLIFQGNLLFLSFQSNLQISIAFSVNIPSKVNYIYFCFIYFAVILYAILFYLIYHKNYQRKQSYKTMKHVNFKKYNSYLNKALFIGLKNFIIGFVHSYFLQSNIRQLSILILIKLVLLILCIKFEIIFIHKYVKFLTSLYYISSIGIDILLLVSSSNIFEKTSKNLILILEGLFLIILILSVILNIIILILCEIKYLFTKKKIMDKTIFKQKATQKKYIYEERIFKNQFLFKQKYQKKQKYKKEQQKYQIKNTSINKSQYNQQRNKEKIELTNKTKINNIKQQKNNYFYKFKLKHSKDTNNVGIIIKQNIINKQFHNQKLQKKSSQQQQNKKENLKKNK